VDLFSGLVLGLETSCDETSASVLLGSTPLSNIISSQADLHEKWGGVVPEAAARAHVEAVLPVIEEALSESNTSLAQIQAIAVTNRPGLVGALSVGVTAAKTLAFVRKLPLIGVHHLEGHLLSPYLDGQQVPCPHASLIASGGHTEIVLVQAPGNYQIVGQTIDDAAGEAFDKTARLFGLGYPGGRAIQIAANGGDPNRYPLPRGLSGDTLDFSFSGLKTAVLRLVEKEGSNLKLADAAASVQEAIVSVLGDRLLLAAESHQAKAVTLVGGVAANLALRERIQKKSDQAGLPFATAKLEHCTDNAAMIALAGSRRLATGQRDGLDLETLPNAPLPAA
jgi:N6-L-threonylcarbamoyladenine synthase